MGRDFDLSKFDEYREDNRREVKRANGGLPLSLWETYSAFANGYGGVIILGVKEEKNGQWITTGLKNPAKLCKDFWDTINNPKKVNLNLLSESDVDVYEVGEDQDVIMVIHVPMARREQKPIYINNDLFNGTYRRNFEGDYHCSRLQVKSMLRDQTETTMDMKVLDEALIDDLNFDSIHGYRNSHRSLRSGHPFERLDDYEYLRSIGAAAISSEDHQLHPTAAGMLMFGNEYDIVRYFPEYFLDYREEINPTLRWSDRVQSSSGEWSGNLFDFYFMVYNRLSRDLKVPFKMKDGIRIDDTPVHKAVREALANCLVNADYYGLRGVVIRKTQNEIVLANPGYIRTGKVQMLKGGESDPRNKALMKMFNLINVGERAGSGVPNIFNVWNDEGWKTPVIEERFDPDRTILTLPFEKEEVKENNQITHIEKEDDLKQKIIDCIKSNPTITTTEIADKLDIARRTVTRKIKELRENGVIERVGSDKTGHWNVSI